jgi:hypothetical protein
VFVEAAGRFAIGSEIVDRNDKVIWLGILADVSASSEMRRPLMPYSIPRKPRRC